MKSEGQLRQRLKQMKFRTVKKEIENLLGQCSKNCRFNYLLGSLKQDNQTPLSHSLNGGVYVCKCPDYDLHICDARFVEEDPAKQCPYFAPRHNAESIKQSLSNFIDTAPLAELSVRFPQISTLLWVLQEDEPKED